MKIHAFILGSLDGFLIGVLTWLISRPLRKLSWSTWILNVCMVVLSFGVFLILEFPFKMLVSFDWLEITNFGHAGLNFIFPALFIWLFSFIGIAINIAFF